MPIQKLKDQLNAINTRKVKRFNTIKELHVSLNRLFDATNKVSVYDLFSYY